MNSLFSKILWALVIAAIAGSIGYRYGDAFVGNARDRRFFGAAAIVAGALIAASGVALLAYCAALIITGDFGLSIGIFGAFRPNGLFQKLLGTAMVFIMGFLANLVSSIVIGFIGGYLTALLFDDHY